MKIEEIKELLRAAGLSEGWMESKEGPRTHPILAEQRALLEGAEKLLQLQIQQDMDRIAQLNERLARLKAVQNG